MQALCCHEMVKYLTPFLWECLQLLCMKLASVLCLVQQRNRGYCSSVGAQKQDLMSCTFTSFGLILSLYSPLCQMYITSTIKTKSSRLAKPVLCLGTLCSAFLTGLNRVSEYRNHCSDVVAGFILGSAVALFLVRTMDR